MNSKTLIGVALALLVILIGLAFIFLKGGIPSATNSNTSPQTANNQISLRTLVEANKPVTCTFSTTTEAGTQNGTVHIANGMVAGEFKMIGGNMDGTNAYLLVRDSTSYVWTSMNNVGFKSTIVTNAKGKTTSVDYDTTFDFSCGTWVVDAKKFIIPQEITFTDPSSLPPL